MGESPILSAITMTLFKTTLISVILLGSPLVAHATSFDCNLGRSATEKLICHNEHLSKLDDELGKLYWKARRAVTDKRSFRADSDAKWTWRETHCTDETCLATWYSGRIGELQQMVDDLQSISKPSPVRPASVNLLAEPAIAMGRCTISEPGMISLDNCRSLMKSNMHWKYDVHGGDWFCGVAVLDESKLPKVALQ
ncbi:MAG: hypothetical protein QOG58_2756 [Caballeronia sp.]|nr:hypothetical protein [Caballeronia sp.]